MTTITKGYEVFIASTLGDLEAERDLVARCVTNSGNHPILIERFPISIERPQVVMNSAIERAEIFVLIIGSRLGEPVREGSSSYTDYEYEYAVKLNKPIVVFMLSEDRLHEELNKIEIDQRNDIWQFRDKVKHARQVVYFRNTEDLAVKFDAALRDVIELQNVAPKGNRAIGLYFETKYSVENIISKLQALNSIYVQLCELTGASSIDYPLTIQNLETGSLWVKVFGESKVISLFINLIKSGISYMHRNLTVEGKIEQIPNKLETLDTFLDLSKKLEEIGVDTKDLNDNINNSALVIAKNLNQLLSETSKLEIQSERITIEKLENQSKGSV